MMALRLEFILWVTCNTSVEKIWSGVEWESPKHVGTGPGESTGESTQVGESCWQRACHSVNQGSLAVWESSNTIARAFSRKNSAFEPMTPLVH